jgi:hypothetical protein
MPPNGPEVIPPAPEAISAVPEQGSVEQAAQVSTNTFELPVVSTEAVGPPPPASAEVVPLAPQAAPTEIGLPPAADPAMAEIDLANMPRFEAPPAPEPGPLYDPTVDESRRPIKITTIHAQGPPPQQQ